MGARGGGNPNGYPVVHGEVIYPDVPPQEGGNQGLVDLYLEQMLASEDDHRGSLIDSFNEPPDVGSYQQDSRTHYGQLRSPYEEQLMASDPSLAGDRASLWDEMSRGPREYSVDPMTMGGPGGPPSPDPDRYVGQQVVPPELPLEQNSWEQFQAMNPNLDYAAVAQQAGGIPGSFPAENEFGGAISEMPPSAKQQEQVQDLMDYVQNQIPQDELARKQDPRSRAYDPGGAAQLLLKMKQDQESQAMSAQTRIQEIQANAAMKEAEAYEMLAGQGRTAGGYPHGGDTQGGESVSKQAEGWAESILSFMTGKDPKADDAIRRDASIVRILADLGRMDEVKSILDKYSGQNPDDAQPTQGTKDVARREGTRAVTPTGREWKENKKTGELDWMG